jgi:tetrahydromethanopterin S-methyltransferase subunit G
MRGMDWTHISLTSIIAFLVAWLARPYFGSYLNKKGENRATHEDLDKINRQLETIKSDFVGVNAYTSKKAEGLATKEDIAEITRKVEEVKGEVSLSLELRKWELGKKATIHRLAAEAEFAEARKRFRPVSARYETVAR